MADANKESIRPAQQVDIFIVDDDRISLTIPASVAKRLGPLIRAKCFQRPGEALAWARDHTLDLAITDYLMPEMNGIEFACQLRAMRLDSELSIMMVSGMSDEQVRYQALGAGIVDFIVKPIDIRECDARIRNLLTVTLLRRALAKRRDPSGSEIHRVSRPA